MARPVIVTALYGGYGRLLPQAEQDLDVHWVAYTDDWDLVNNPPEPWTVFFEPARMGPGGRRAAKWRKCWPQFASMLWIDANIEIIAPTFAREALACTRDGIALYRHPRRDCIYEEGEASLGMESQGGKYESERTRIEHQMLTYRERGEPEHGGLYACGILAWDASNPKAWRLGANWLSQIKVFSVQDQLSFPVSCRTIGVNPGVFPHPQITYAAPILGNPWLKIHPHFEDVAA